MALSIGDEAPEFEIPGVDGATGVESQYSLRSYVGSPVVLAFYPADNSPVCKRQLVAYTRDIAELDRLDAQLLAISPQGTEEHKNFAAQNGGFAFPLLSDLDREVARSYHNLGLLDLYKRSIFVLDSKQRIVWTHRSIGPGLRFQSTDRIVEAIDQS